MQSVCVYGCVDVYLCASVFGSDDDDNDDDVVVVDDDDDDDDYGNDIGSCVNSCMCT